MPNPTLAYVLVHDGTTRFPAMAYLSVMAARKVEPNARVILITDEATPAHLHREKAAILGAVDAVHAVDEPCAHPAGRSYRLKTRIWDVIAGDYVYLDSDTLPVRPFYCGMATGTHDAAFVQDRNHHAPLVPGEPFWIFDRMRTHGVDVKFSRYFNAGLGFWRDSTQARSLMDAWKERCRISLAIGDHDDQLPLNIAIAQHSANVLELPPPFNAMVTVHPALARHAKIYHFFAGNRPTLDDSLFEYLLAHLQSTGKIDWDAIAVATAIDYPWMPPYWPRRLWQTGNRLRAIREAVRQLPAKLARRITPKAAS